MKEKFNWTIPHSKISKCDKILIFGDKRHQQKYITTYLKYNNLKFKIINSDLSILEKNQCILKINNKFDLN